MNRCFILALCLFAITVPSQAQMLEHDILPTDQLDLFTLPIDPIQFDPAEQTSAEQLQSLEPILATGEDALLNDIPDANTLIKDLASMAVVDKNNHLVLNEVNVQHGWRAIKQEWLLLLPADQVAQLGSLPIKVIAANELPLLQMHTVRIQVTERFDDLKRLTDLLAPLGVEVLERHHLYDAQAASDNSTNSMIAANTRIDQQTPTGQSSNPVSIGINIGIIDTAIDRQHEAFSQLDIQAKSFINDAMHEPMAHATAVLGRLVGKGKDFSPLLPKARVYAASVFYQKDAYSQSAPTIALLQALEWMLKNRVKVINMSLAGPPNTLLAKALQRMRAQGIAVIAAAGNAGPASRPLFPAAYDSVIAVSAVDKHQRIYRWANRGHHIDFVAHGVNVTTLRAGGGEGMESGTSMAAPVISAAIALQMQKKGLQESLTSLRSMTKDLGESGRDVIYGDGYIAEQSVTNR